MCIAANTVASWENIYKLYTVGAGLSVVGRTETVAVLEGDSATLVCGTDLTGNPMPSVSWRDNNNRLNRHTCIYSF